MAGVCTDPREKISPPDTPVINKLCHCGSFYLLWLWEEMGREEIEASEQGGGTQIIQLFFFSCPADNMCPVHQLG